MDTSGAASTVPERDWYAALEASRQSLQRGDWAGTEAACRELVEAAAAAGRLEVAAEAAATGAKAAFNDARLDRAEALAREALDFAARVQSAALQAVAWVVMSGIHARAERPRDAVEAVARALDFLDENLPARVRRSVYLGLDVTYGALGLWRLAAEAGSAAREADEALESDAATQIFSCLTYVDSLLRAYDDLDEGVPAEAAALLTAARREMATLDRSLAAKRGGWLQAYGSLVQGSLLRRTGDTLDALARLRPLSEDDGVLDPDMRFVVWVERAQAEAANGDADAARASAETAIGRLTLAARQSPGSVGLTELQRLWRAQQLAGDARAALRTLSTYHQRVLRNTVAWIDAKTAGVSRELSETTLRLQNADLREHNAGLSRRVEDIARVAISDGLTGVLTRRAAVAVHDRLAAQGRSFALLLVDVDHFKQVNDRHGHLVGDRVLREVARRLQLALRVPDQVGRYGGEEFVVLLPGVPLEVALSVAERLRTGVEAEGWSALAPDLSVTVSIGCTMVASGERFESSLHRADAGLYRAKHTGRNRVEVVLPPEPAGTFAGVPPGDRHESSGATSAS